MKGTSATAVAVTVRAMTTNPLTQGIFYAVQIFRRVFLPHLAAGAGLFLLIGCALYFSGLQPFSSSVKIILSVLIFSAVGSICFGYALVASCVYAIHLACGAWEDFIDDIIDKVQAVMLARVENLQDGIAKDQAKVLVRGSVREVFQNTRRAPSALPKWMLTLCLGVLMLMVRAVLTARVIKLAGTTVKVSKIFAGKATLAGAVFLNLRLFTTLVLWLIYGAGGIVLFLTLGLILR